MRRANPIASLVFLLILVLSGAGIRSPQGIKDPLKLPAGVIAVLLSCFVSSTIQAADQWEKAVLAPQAKVSPNPVGNYGNGKQSLSAAVSVRDAAP